jgi:hypothetical protein
LICLIRQTVISAQLPMMAAELGVSLIALGRSIADHFAMCRTFPGVIGGSAQIVFALLPIFQDRRGRLKCI